MRSQLLGGLPYGCSGGRRHAGKAGYIECPDLKWQWEYATASTACCAPKVIGKEGTTVFKRNDTASITYTTKPFRPIVKYYSCLVCFVTASLFGFITSLNVNKQTPRTHTHTQQGCRSGVDGRSGSGETGKRSVKCLNDIVVTTQKSAD